MQVIYLLPWLVPLLLILLGVIISTHTIRHLSKRHHAPEMFDTPFSIRGFLRQIHQEKLLFKETMSAQEPL
jgi:cytochrome c-type biogenesis protein CcmH/NrfF